MRSNGARMRYLDGLRGVAITAVVLWHFLGPSEARILPYGNRYADVPILSSGWMGVELFFLISGYVIFLTVEKCSGVFDFMVRRWLRLFPAMLIATVLLFAMDRVARMPGPHGPANVIDILPGIALIDPSIWQALLRMPVRSLSGSFWTLYTEVAFYIVFSTVYFRVGWRAAIGVLLAASIIPRCADNFPQIDVLHLSGPMHRLNIQYFGWFASGALFYKAWRDGDRVIFTAAVAAGLIAAATFHNSFGTVLQQVQMAIIVALFAVIQVSQPIQRLLSTRAIVFIGNISYPLYLIHANVGLPLIVWVAPLITPLPPEVAACLALMVVIIAAWLIQRFGEPWVKAQLVPLTDRARVFAKLVLA